MAIYILMHFILILSFLYWKRCFSASLVKSYTAAIIISFIIFAFVGFRYEVGADWHGYKKLLDYYRLDDLIGASDPLFVLIMKVSNLFSFGLSNQVMNVLFGALFTLGIFIHFGVQKKQPAALVKFYSIGYPIVILLIGMGYLRQGIASIGILLCWESFKEKKIRNSLIFCLLAASIHKSALIFLCFPIFLAVQDHFQKNRKFVFWGFGFSVIIFFFLLTIWGERYLDHSMSSGGAQLRIAYLLLFLFAFAYQNRAVLKLVRNPFFISVSLLGLLISFFYSTLLDRIILFFFAIIFSEIASHPAKDKRDSFLILALSTLAMIYTYVWLQYSYWGHGFWVPYKFYFLEFNK